MTVTSAAGDRIVASTWEDLRKQARALETSIDVKLLNFNKLGTTLGSGSSLHQPEGSRLPTSVLQAANQIYVSRATQQAAAVGSFNSNNISSSQSTFEALTLDIQNLVDQLTDVNERMEEVTRDASYSRNPASTHTLQRHREILQDYTHEFKRIQDNVRGLLQREMLMSSSSAGVCKINMSSDGLNNRRSDFLLKEHDHIKSSHRLLDDQIGLAINTKEGLFGQQKTLKSIVKKMNTLTKRYPAIHSLMQKIQIRKRRDAMIIAGIVSVCLFFFFLYGNR